ncbi:solute carrier family 23 protein [Niallia sp. XMNu-256]|uniref:uracil-xanthine permease family protein n=1 Tax=Niallia sp. XMNu-256 TaxID=3082444 RepID=UPI0030CCF0E6
MSKQQPVLDIKDIPSPFQWLTLSFQHLFAMFGATVLVPVLVGLSPAVALISSGIATILFLIFTKWQVPAYLGSSFAFIAPIIAATAAEGTGGAMIGCFMIGIVYIIVAFVIKVSGYQWIMKLLPPIVVGPVIMVIGLALAPTAVGMAMNNPKGEYDLAYFSAGIVTLIATILFSVFSKGFLGQVSILAGIIVGYIYSVIIGIVNFTPVLQASWFEWPEFVVPFVDYEVTISTDIMLLMIPISIVTISEHIGHQLVLSKVVGKDYIKEPGLHRSILGDGLGTMISAIIGGPPKTTYGENIGVLAITKVYSVYIILGAAVFALILGFIGKMTALINTIPQPVMGGVSILLFGIIASSGLRMLIDNKVDFSKNRNLAIASVILVLGIGGAFIQVWSIQLQGMAFAAIAGVVLNLVLPGKEKIEDDIFETQLD